MFRSRVEHNIVLTVVIVIHWTFHFVYFMGRTICKLKGPTKYLFTLVIFTVDQVLFART